MIILQTVVLLGRVISLSQGLYLNTGHHKHRINTYTHQTSMPCVGFEPTIPASERAKTVHATARLLWPAPGFPVHTGLRGLQNRSGRCGAEIIRVRCRESDPGRPVCTFFVIPTELDWGCVPAVESIKWMEYLRVRNWCCWERLSYPTLHLMLYFRPLYPVDKVGSYSDRPYSRGPSLISVSTVCLKFSKWKTERNPIPICGIRINVFYYYNVYLHNFESSSWLHLMNAHLYTYHNKFC
jgi:hypothetical protein